MGTHQGVATETRNMTPPQHRITNVNAFTKTGTCAICGEVKVKRHRQAHGKHGWRCSVKHAAGRAQERRKQAARNGSWAPSPKAKRKARVIAALGSDHCQRCGFEPEHVAQMDVHHKDRNHGNDSPENLELICSNCHRLEHAVDRYPRNK